MAPRTLIAWFFIIAVICVGLFFTYHIVQASDQKPVEPLVTPVQPANNVPEMVMNSAKPIQDLAVVSEPTPPMVQPLVAPQIVAQTREAVKETRPVQETPPPIQYAEPEAMDPMEGTVNMESEFGDTLRHPEQMIEMQPPMGTMRAIREPASQGGNRGVQYSPELAMNGAEFMQGIMAFDGSDAGGIGFSMI